MDLIGKTFQFPLGLPGVPSVDLEPVWPGSVRITPPENVPSFVLTAEVLREMADIADRKWTESPY